MKIVFLIFLLIVTSCKVNKVVKHHGVHYLDKKHEKLIINEKPDIVVVVGDVNSTMACSITAAKLKIKTAHVEAGLMSFDMKNI